MEIESLRLKKIDNCMKKQLYLKKLEDGEEKEETADAENVDETNVEEANEVENVETSEENKDEE